MKLNENSTIQLDYDSELKDIEEIKTSLEVVHEKSEEPDFRQCWHTEQRQTEGMTEFKNQLRKSHKDSLPSEKANDGEKQYRMRP